MNASKKIKAYIRISRASYRLSKTIYSTNPIKKKIAKFNEEVNMLSNSITKTWRVMYSIGFKSNNDNENPRYYDHFKFISDSLAKQIKINKKIDDLCARYGLIEEDIMREHYLLNAGRLSQSY